MTFTPTRTDGDGDRHQATRGRRPSTTRREVARAALELFERQGYEETSIDQIAAAVGVSRRTFFRYYESKREVVWGEFDAELVRLRERLEGARDDQPMIDVLRHAVIDINSFGAGELDELRIRIGLTSSVPTLVAHSAVRYAEWCEVVAAFAARRLGVSPDDLAPQTVARAALGAATSAFISWAGGGGEDLGAEVDRAFRMLAAGFDEERLRGELDAR
jgi:mycofactocin system transcriptional regulator